MRLKPQLKTPVPHFTVLTSRVFVKIKRGIFTIVPHLSEVYFLISHCFSRRGFLLASTSALALWAVSGCSSNSGSGSTTAATPTTVTIISPHSHEIQNEFADLWKKSHPETQIKWLDQGGTSDALKFVRSEFATRGKEKGIGVDLFFGGGGETFAELEDDGLLVPLGETYGIPDTLNGVPLRGKNDDWVAAALSGFGILYNKKIAARDGLPVPQTWADLANPKLQERVELADPRHSGSAHTVYEIILQTNGWDKGWKILTAMTGNARKFAITSSEPLQDVKNGEAVFCSAIDFYATTAIEQAGQDKLAYIEPRSQNIVTADPIGLLPAAPNEKMAREFIKMVLSPAGQKLWFAPKGSEGGPTSATLYRLPALPAAYKTIPAGAWTQADPYAAKTTANYDSDKAASRRNALDDLIGSVLVDNIDPIKRAWKKNPNLEQVGYVPMSETEFAKIAPKWSEKDAATFINQTKAQWNAAARKHFGG